MTDKELLERLKSMYIDESEKLRQAKLEKEKAAARRAVLEATDQLSRRSVVVWVLRK